MRPVQVTPQLEAYISDLLPEREEVLARIEREAEVEGLPIVGPYEGACLRLLVRIAGARRVLELGTAVGYSGIWLLRGTAGGSLTTYEVDPGRARRARANFEQAGLGHAARVVEADALSALEDDDEHFDACFIDLLTSFDSEATTERAFHLCVERLEAGGLLMADNALRQGEVVKPDGPAARNVDRYNRLVASHPRLVAVILPIRDGLSVARLGD